MTMRVKPEFAVISFCRDLTDPDAGSEPVALIGIYHGLDGSSACFVATRSDLAEDGEMAPDVFTREFLDDLPDFLMRQVSEGLAEAGEERLISWIHDNLRNSLHVSEITRRSETVELASIQQTVQYFIPAFQTLVLNRRDLPDTEEASVMSAFPSVQMRPLAALHQGRSAADTRRFLEPA